MGNNDKLYGLRKIVSLPLTLNRSSLTVSVGTLPRKVAQLMTVVALASL